MSDSIELSGYASFLRVLYVEPISGTGCARNAKFGQAANSATGCGRIEKSWKKAPTVEATKLQQPIAEISESTKWQQAAAKTRKSPACCRELKNRRNLLERAGIELDPNFLE